ncbi:DNA polymerase III subunit alpha [Spiroplasma endosymbiont of Nephrotoma flavescens]|uniref:DNA polymerase III subunit alpha n=1 Tax=Spiroplasma endosymbiont of Nephrotoma flavescens TaxID=3066302 RepID=UPI00313ADB13
MKIIINLNVHSEYSLLSSPLKLKDYFKFAIKNNLSVLALTDKNTMFGTIQFYEQCQKYNIKPIIGIDIDVLDIARNLKLELIVIAKNQQGYEQLCLISSIIAISNNSTISCEQLLEHLNEIIVIFKPQNTLTMSLTMQAEYLTRIQKKAHTYMGINQDNFSNIQYWIDRQQLVVPCNLVKYLQSDDNQTLQLIEAIKEQKLLAETSVNDFSNYHYLLSFDIYCEYEQILITNLEQLINNVNLQLQFNIKENMLQYVPPIGVNSNEYLQNLCLQRLQNNKEINNDYRYQQRLSYELSIICEMGFANYFLIVYDYVKYAREQNIMVGPGRGSVAGSLVAFLLQISTVDPIKYDLIFERFLNPQRISMPDIDIDFQDDRREEVIKYLVEKYGKNNVAQIITFQTITCKIALKDTGRVLNIPLDIIDKISKAVPLDLNLDLSLAVSKIEILQVYMTQYPQLFLLAKKIIGLPRQFGTHAAGVVLSQLPIMQIVPIQKGYNNIYLTQYSMNHLESLGLLKMDLLGLRNLTNLKQILDMINKDLSMMISLDKIPLNDSKTYQLLSEGYTAGIFQLESKGMQQILITMQPKNLEDIVVTSSLFRPGPQEHIKTYIKRRLKQEAVWYLHPDLQPILKTTYGIIVYQEQIILIAQKIANFSLAKADILRRAISKKNQNEMTLLSKEFIASGVANGYDEKTVKQIYDDINQFASYGFNRSHAVSYSLLGYWMAYLKVNYALQFMCALLTSVIASANKIEQYLKECQRYHLKILPPSVNFSTENFIIENHMIRVPLTIIKQVGMVMYEAIYAEREANGQYTDYFSFVARMVLKGLNISILEALIAAGALDEFKISRKTMKLNMTLAFRYAQLIQVSRDENITLNYDLVAIPSLKQEPDNLLEKAQDELKYFGFYLQTHPLLLIKKQLQLEKEIIKLQNLDKLINWKVKVLVFINRIKQIKTKDGQYMCFLTVSDDYGTSDVTVFSNIYMQYQEQLKENTIVLINATVEKYNDKIHLVLRTLKVISI